MERELEALRTEITHLRQDLRALASRVERQEDQLRLLGQCQSSQSLSYSQALDRFEGVPFVTGPESSAWTVVQEEGETPARTGALQLSSAGHFVSKSRERLGLS